MRVTIIVDDNVVLVEDIAYKVDCSPLIENDIHAIQWYGTHGEVEFSTDMITGGRRANVAIDNFEICQPFVDAWEVEAQKPAIPPFVEPPSVLSQDLMAQFTADDAIKIRAAVEANAQFWLLWSAMQAQRDPMKVENARFLAGWNALRQVLGVDRMDEIAAALGVTVK